MKTNSVTEAKIGNGRFGALWTTAMMAAISLLASGLTAYAADTTDDQLGTVTAQGENGSGEGMLKAFDNSSGTKWLDFANANPSTRASWIQYAYANGKSGRLTGYTVTSANDAPERDPADWQLLGSNDGGANWVTVDSRSNVVFSGRFQMQSFALSGNPTWKAYRLNIQRVYNPGSACAVQLSEIELLGDQVVVGGANQPPVANAQSVTTAEDAPKAITLTATDPDSPNLTYNIVGNPAHGSLSGSGTNRTYTPALNYNGPDSFTFQASDGQTNSNIATVSITVSPVNDAPTVTANATPTSGTAPLTVAFTATGSDVDVGDTLTYSWVFGDGQNSTAQNPSHSYASAGAYTATVTVNDGHGGTASANVAITVTSGGGAGQGSRMRIDLSGYTKAETLTDFPVLVVLGANRAGFAYSQFISPSGWDLRFTASDGITDLPYEIEKWDASSLSYVWVRVPTLTSTAWLTASWGDAAKATQPAYTTNGTVWANGYAGVWHLGETGGSVAGDSTANAKHGAKSAGGITVGVGGKAGNAYQFDGASGIVSAPLVSSSVNNTTFGLWARIDAASDDRGGIFFNGSGPNGYGLFAGGQDAPSSTLYFLAQLKYWQNTGVGWTVGAWQHFVVTLMDNGSKTDWRLFKNGALVFGPVSLDDPSIPTVETKLGAENPGSSIAHALDEVRFSSTVRSADWIWAEYQTTAANDTFCAYGAVQAGGGSTLPGPVFMIK